MRKQGCKFSRIYLNFPKFTGIHLNLPKFTFFEKRVTHGRTDGWTKPLMEWHFATKKKKINADCWGPTKRSGIVISSGDVKCHLFLGSGKILSLRSAILPPPAQDGLPDPQAHFRITRLAFQDFLAGFPAHKRAPQALQALGRGF